MRFKIKLKFSGDGGKAGRSGDAPPSPRPQPWHPLDPTVRPLPPRPANEHTDALHDEVLEEGKHIAKYMSAKISTPNYIVRLDWRRILKNTYFSLRKNWNQLLDGKRTYLRPSRDRQVSSGVFRCPDARPRTLGQKEPLVAMISKYPEECIIRKKIKILSHRYWLFRQTREDGSCFYRAFLFSYLENLAQMQDREAEVTRLMECLARSRQNFCRLKWDKAYFLKPDEYFSSVVSDLKHLVNSVAKGLSSDELYKRSLEEIISSRILSLLRLLAETEIRTRPEDYKPVIPQEMSALRAVRPMDADALTPAMRAITYALGIPLRAEALAEGLTNGAVRVKP